MLVTEFGMIILARLVQLSNAPSPIILTELGMSIPVSSVHPANAPLPILVTELGITVFLQPVIIVLVAVSMIALQLLRESYFGFELATLMLARLEQLWKVELLILVMELGKSMLINPEQPKKA